MNEVADRLVRRFQQIGVERIYGLPIYNEALTVEAVDFQTCNGDVIGVLVTPWFVNVMLLPADTSPWQGPQIGERVTYLLESGAQEFVIGEDEEIGRYLFRTVASPTHCFKQQIAAITDGRHLLKALLAAPEKGRAEALPDSQAAAVAPRAKEEEHNSSRRNFLRVLVSS